MTRWKIFTMFRLDLTGEREKDEAVLLSYLEASMYPISDEMDFYGNLSNVSSLLSWYIEDINWVGFYLRRKEELVLGPFQGEPACFLIPFSRGVCGKCARERKTVIVADVSAFPGHIACSAMSQSELVVPLLISGELWGVIDIDSPSLSRFEEGDRLFIERVASLISSSMKVFLLKYFSQKE